MDRNSRPIVVVPYGENDQGCFIETPTKTISVKTAPSGAVVELLAGAYGTRAIHEMANEEFTEYELTSFFSQLEKLNACFDAHLLAQYGQLAARYPDPLRIYPGDAVGLQMMKLPPDLEGRLLEVDGVEDGSPLDKRSTCRFFTQEPLTCAEISTIAVEAYGITGQERHFNRRTVPSAGAIYPLQLDYIIRRGDGVEPGVYRWAKHANGLVRYQDICEDTLSRCFIDRDWLSTTVILVISYDIMRSAVKYASRAHRFALVEAGHVAQNAIMAATRMDLGSWEYGNYADNQLVELVGLSPITGGLATVLMFGRMD